MINIECRGFYYALSFDTDERDLLLNNLVSPIDLNNLTLWGDWYIPKAVASLYKKNTLYGLKNKKFLKLDVSVSGAGENFCLANNFFFGFDNEAKKYPETKYYPAILESSLNRYVFIDKKLLLFKPNDVIIINKAQVKLPSRFMFSISTVNGRVYLNNIG